jgi:hypothetical protein
MKKLTHDPVVPIISASCIQRTGRCSNRERILIFADPYTATALDCSSPKSRLIAQTNSSIGAFMSMCESARMPLPNNSTSTIRSTGS